MLNRVSLTAFTAALLSLTLLGPQGCVEREETIRVAPDGTIHLKVEFEGGLDDVVSGDALLQDPGPWTVEDRIETDDKGEQTLTRTATLTVPPGGEIPTHYAGDDDELADLALNISTSLEIEERPYGTYYHFQRIYHRRDWSHIDYFRRTYLEDELKKLDGEDVAELSEQDRQNVAEALIAFEQLKTLVLAETAANALDPPLSQDVWLPIFRGICGVFENIDRHRVMELLQLEGEEAEAEITAAVEEVKARTEDVIEAVVNQSDPSGATTRAFVCQYEREQRRYAITEDLQDETIEVFLHLPGRIIGHNSIGEQADGGAVEWEFDGEALYDRDQVLLATSVVEHE